MEEAQKRLKENGATTLELALLQEMYAFLQFKKDCKKELEGLKEVHAVLFPHARKIPLPVRRSDRGEHPL